MSTTTPARALIDELLRITVFADLEPEQLAWFVAQSTLRELAPGDVLFRQGDPADVMFVLLEGEVNARPENVPSDGRVFVARAGEVSGMLPFSRMTHWGGTSRAVLPTRVLCFPATQFPELLRRIPALEARLVQTMADRVRETTRLDQQREKLMALGKLSAGLAHELNNPAAATGRSASELRRCLRELDRLTGVLLDAGISGAQLRALAELSQPQGVEAPAPPPDPVLRAECEDEVAEWLEERGVEHAWNFAESFVTAGVDRGALDAAAGDIPASALPDALSWLGTSLTAEGLLTEVERAAGRISELVASVKAYSHMDRAAGKTETDIHAGLDSTLVMLGHKVRDKSVTLEREYAAGLPRVAAHPGELNQVWTNLLDNALDAVQPGGHVRIRTVQNDTHVVVEFGDDGPGIPAELQSRIWEPFFTTKDVGQGTGLGLDIARRIVVRQHGGDIRVASQPGNTRFTVSLPIYAADGLPEGQETGNGDAG